MAPCGVWGIGGARKFLCMRPVTLCREHGQKNIPIASRADMPTLQLCYLMVRQSLVLKRRSRRANRILAACTAIAVCSMLYWEMRSSTLQARPFAWSASALNYTVAEGPSPSIRFPKPGPFDERLGYSRLPQFLERLTGEHFVI